MTDKQTPTDAELKAMWQIHAADIGGIFDFASAVLAKWGQPAQAAEPVAWWIPKAEQFCIAGKSGDRPFAKAWEPLYTTPQPTQPVAREQLTDGQIQDLLLCGNPTDEEMRLIRIGWDAARGIKGGQHGTE